ncbi:MAG TPA: hypothetical protein ENN34_07015 [Deltaproteobacteria bacterium]|nr:hypothetical protein [Deltaproteobacteria bacterium]
MSLETFFGWSIAVFVVLCLLNFVLKQISRDYIKKLPASRQDFANAYRSVMRVVVKNHRMFGFGALLLLPVHFMVVYLSEILSLTGLISGAALIATAGMGIYGFYLRRDYRSWWLTVHRLLAVVVVVAVITHLFVKGYIFL